MRNLHTMLRVGDLEKSIDFYVNGLGMNLIKKIILMGHSRLPLLVMDPRNINVVMELIYKWGKTEYNKGRCKVT